MTHPALLASVDAILAELRPLDAAYFRALHDGSLSREDFVATQVQFHRAVEDFHRPMASLAIRIPDLRLRTDILRNVWEEVGEGELGASHGLTFREFLRRVGGLSPEAVVAARVWPEVDAFNLALHGACAQGSHLLGAAALGMIERMFGEISGRIGRGVVARGWLAPEAMTHYDLHEVLDVRHAADFFAVVQGPFLNDPEARAEVERGLWLGATIFTSLYAGLYAARARRWDP